MKEAVTHMPLEDSCLRALHNAFQNGIIAQNKEPDAPFYLFIVDIFDRKEFNTRMIDILEEWTSDKTPEFTKQLWEDFDFLRRFVDAQEFNEERPNKQVWGYRYDY